MDNLKHVYSVNTPQCGSQIISSQLASSWGSLSEQEQRSCEAGVAERGTAEARARRPLHTSHKSSPLSHKPANNPDLVIGSLQLLKLDFSSCFCKWHLGLWSRWRKFQITGQDTQAIRQTILLLLQWNGSQSLPHQGVRTNIQQWSGGHNGKTQLCFGGDSEPFRGSKGEQHWALWLVKWKSIL